MKKITLEEIDNYVFDSCKLYQEYSQDKLYLEIKLKPLNVDPIVLRKLFPELFRYVSFYLEKDPERQEFDNDDKLTVKILHKINMHRLYYGNILSSDEDRMLFDYLDRTKNYFSIVNHIPPKTIDRDTSQQSKDIDTNSESTIWVTFQKEGIHKYPAAKTDPGLKDVSFLQYPHRHIFHFTVEINVNHDDRDIEFILLKRDLEAMYDNKALQLDFLSCEMIARTLAKTVLDKYKRDFVKVTVSEDGENGANITLRRKINENVRRSKSEG